MRRGLSTYWITAFVVVVIILIILLCVFLAPGLTNVRDTFANIVGSITQAGAGSWQFVPTQYYYGPVSIVYQLTDGTTSADNTLSFNILESDLSISVTNAFGTLAPAQNQYTPYVFTGTQLIAASGATDPNSGQSIMIQNITISAISLDNYGSVASPIGILTTSSSGGSSTLAAGYSNGTQYPANTTFIFTPNPNYGNIKVTLTFQYVDADFGLTAFPGSSATVGPANGSISFVLPYAYQVPKIIPVTLSGPYYENNPVTLSLAQLIGTSTSDIRHTLMPTNISVFDNPSGTIFGSGSDGAVTISTTMTLTRDMNYSSLTINSGATLYTGGYRILSTGPVIINGIADNSGQPGQTNNYFGTQGTMFLGELNVPILPTAHNQSIGGLGGAQGTLPGGVQGGNGTPGNSGTNYSGITNMSNNPSGTYSNGSGVTNSLLNSTSKGASGTAGNNTSCWYSTLGQLITGNFSQAPGGGNALYTVMNTPCSYGPNIPANTITNPTTYVTPSFLSTALTSGMGIGTSGAGGSSPTTTPGNNDNPFIINSYNAAGGSASGSGGIVYIAAPSITGQGIISANSGNGGNGGALFSAPALATDMYVIGPAGGGASSSGGLIYIITENAVPSSLQLQVQAGAPGTGSPIYNGVSSTPIAYGPPGTKGSNGTIVIFQLGASTTII